MSVRSTARLVPAALFAACAVLLAQCSGLRTDVEGSNIPLKQARTYNKELAEGVRTYYVQWNADSIGMKSGTPNVRGGKFLAARYFDYNGKHYAVVRVEDSTFFLCNGCSDTEWQAKRQGLTGKFAKNQTMQKNVSYGTDDENRRVIYVQLINLYASMHDDGYWYVYSTPVNVAKEEMLWRKFSEEEARPW